MATGGMDGDVAVWDLEERRLLQILRCHDGPVHTCFFYLGLSILLTASADNSIKQWIFDSPDGSSRLLKSRSGFAGTAREVMYYGEGGDAMLATGDGVRFFSGVRDSQNVELSQGKLEHKARKLDVSIEGLRLAPVVQFHSSMF